jgi:methyltransferase (TIGR00027 family)
MGGLSVARTENDTWEITESVGATALGVAAGRAAETERENPLISDPFARIFLNAAGDGIWNFFAAPELPAEILEAEPDVAVQMESMVGYMASRTAFFDTFFLDAARSGVTQAVILAAGLDSRAWRLPWPDQTTVYELDQTRVLEFKASTIAAYGADHGAEPTCNRVAVAVDLRHDWPAALQQAGFDPSAPSAWSVEGLLPYLPAAAHELLFERIHSLAGPGSRIAVEAPGPDWMDEGIRARRRERMDRLRALVAKADPQREMPSTDELFYFEEREDVGQWLGRHGWEVAATPAPQLMAGYGRGLPEGVDDTSPRTQFVSAVRT